MKARIRMSLNNFAGFSGTYPEESAATGEHVQLAGEHSCAVDDHNFLAVS